jgi:hypothetical protein
METGNWKLEDGRLVLIGFQFRFSSFQFPLPVIPIPRAGEESASFVLRRKSRFLVPALLGMTGLVVRSPL